MMTVHPGSPNQPDRRDQARRKRLEALGYIAGQVSHDMNNKLTVILGNLSLLSYMIEDADDPDVKGALEDTLDAAQQMREQNSRLQSMTGAFAPDRQLFDGCALVKSIVGDWQKEGVACPVSLPEREIMVKVDRYQVRVALTALLENARKAGDRVWVEVVLFTAEAEDPLHIEAGPAIDIKVCDDGSGVEPGLESEIFEPYFSTDTAALGVGLAVARSIARRHHGEVVCEPVEQGACFRLILPASKDKH